MSTIPSSAACVMEGHNWSGGGVCNQCGDRLRCLCGQFIRDDGDHMDSCPVVAKLVVTCASCDRPVDRSPENRCCGEDDPNSFAGCGDYHCAEHRRGTLCKGCRGFSDDVLRYAEERQEHDRRIDARRPFQ